MSLVFTKEPSNLFCRSLGACNPPFSSSREQECLAQDPSSTTGLIYFSSLSIQQVHERFPLVFVRVCAVVQVWLSPLCSHWIWDRLSSVIQAGCTTRQHTVTVICTDLPPLLVLLLQIAIDYNAVVLLTVTMNTSFISFLK